MFILNGSNLSAPEKNICNALLGSLSHLLHDNFHHSCAKQFVLCRVDVDCKISALQKCYALRKPDPVFLYVLCNCGIECFLTIRIDEKNIVFHLGRIHGLVEENIKIKVATVLADVENVTGIFRNSILSNFSQNVSDWQKPLSENRKRRGRNIFFTDQNLKLSRRFNWRPVR
jgi:hypothetical protein